MPPSICLRIREVISLSSLSLLGFAIPSHCRSCGDALDGVTLCVRGEAERVLEEEDGHGPGSVRCGGRVRPEEEDGRGPGLMTRGRESWR